MQGGDERLHQVEDDNPVLLGEVGAKALVKGVDDLRQWRDSVSNGDKVVLGGAADPAAPSRVRARSCPQPHPFAANQRTASLTHYLWRISATVKLFSPLAPRDLDCPSTGIRAQPSASLHEPWEETYEYGSGEIHKFVEFSIPY